MGCAATGVKKGMKSMTFAIKTATRVQAWELGTGSDMEKEMLRNGKIIAHSDGTFEVFTKEATGEKGQSPTDQKGHCLFIFAHHTFILM